MTYSLCATYDEALEILSFRRFQLAMMVYYEASLMGVERRAFGQSGGIPIFLSLYAIGQETMRSELLDSALPIDS
jgi:hypothetical protein